MAVQFNCYLHGGEIEELGGILFSPPVEVGPVDMYSRKMHVCPDCWIDLEIHLDLVRLRNGRNNHN